MKLSDFNKESDYHYIIIDKINDDNDSITMTEYGRFRIGTAFIILESNDKDELVSFVMTGHIQTKGSVYTCIYSDFE